MTNIHRDNDTTKDDNKNNKGDDATKEEKETSATTTSTSIQQQQQQKQQQEQSRTLRLIAAGLGSTGVMLGAMGAHAFKSTLVSRNTLSMWHTASTYQLFHATAILSLSSTLSSLSSSSSSSTNNKNNNNTASSSTSRTYLAGRMLAVGTLLFSGSIYCLALDIGQPILPKSVLGPMTPVGGLILIGGWILIGWT